MLGKWKVPRKKKGGKKGGKRRKGLGATVPRRSLQFKNYSYELKLLPQIIVPTVGAVTWGIANPGAGFAGQQPLTTGEIGVYDGAGGALLNCQDLGLATAFQLTDAVNYTKFTTLYDAYKINKVTMTIEYLNNQTQPGSGFYNPSIWMYYDQDDQIVPANLNNIVGKQGVRKHIFGSDRKNTVTFSFTPTIQMETANVNNTVVPAVVTAKPMWLNCNNANIPHQALKMWITDLSRNTVDKSPAVAFRVNWTYHVSFRSPINAS